MKLQTHLPQRARNLNQLRHQTDTKCQSGWGHLVRNVNEHLACHLWPLVDYCFWTYREYHLAWAHKIKRDLWCWLSVFLQQYSTFLAEIRIHPGTIEHNTLSYTIAVMAPPLPQSINKCIDYFHTFLPVYVVTCCQKS